MTSRFALAAGCVFLACNPPPHSADRATQSASTLALTQDDAFLYAVDTDNELLAVIDTASEEVIAQVKVGTGAHLVVVGADTAYVANRYDHTVSVVRRGEWQEDTRWQAGLEPVGLATSSDGKTLYVVNAVAADTGTHGALRAIDTASGQTKWELALGEEPRGITLIDDAHAAVALLKEGDLQFVDLAGAKLDKAKTDAFDKLNKFVFQNQQSFGGAQGIETQHPRGTAAVVAAPDGTSVHTVGVLARQGQLQAWGGCAGTLMAAPALFSFDARGSAIVDDAFQCTRASTTLPPTVMRTANQNQVIQGPSAMAIERTGRWAFVVNQNSNNVSVVSMVGEGESSPQNFGFGLPDAVSQVVGVGAGANAVAVNRWGNRAYVYNAFDHTVSVLKGEGHTVVKAKDIRVAGDTLSADAVAGRKLFFDAVDSRMSGANLGAACATCHIDNGQEDGHVWTFAEGKRQTVALAGRLSGTAPFHWDGTLLDMDSLMKETTTARMGGHGTTPQMAAQVEAYLMTLPLPLNPKQLTEPSEARLRGAVVFQKAECNSCHSGAKLTNNQFAHVGTNEGTPQQNFFGNQVVSPFPNDGVNVPSLLGLARSAPYLHDGSVMTLAERIQTGKASDLHGKTSQLTEQEVSDLVEYLTAL